MKGGTVADSGIRHLLVRFVERRRGKKTDYLRNSLQLDSLARSRHGRGEIGPRRGNKHCSNTESPYSGRKAKQQPGAPLEVGEQLSPPPPPFFFLKKRARAALLGHLLSRPESESDLGLDEEDCGRGMLRVGGGVFPPVGCRNSGTWMP